MHSNATMTRRSSTTRGEGRNVIHARTSCVTCRMRKIKCYTNARRNESEAKAPCIPCLSKGRDCRWDPKLDGRIANSRDYLKAKTSSLEDDLKRQKLLYEHLLRFCGLPPGFTPPTSPPRSISVDKLSTMLQHGLVLDCNGLHEYGAPSAFYLKSQTTEYRVPSADVASPLPMTSGRTGGQHTPWYRALPMEKVPLTEEEHTTLLKLFFDCFAFWGLPCHQHLFQRDMHAALTPTKTLNLTHYSPMLHNAILAVATAYSGNPRLKNLESRMAFAKKAEEYMSEEFRSPTLSGVQAMSHLATFYVGIGLQTAGSVYFAICSAMAQALGLSLDASKYVEAKMMPEQEKHDRDWLFWVIFVQDKLLALYLGRDMRIPKPHSVRFPDLPQEQHTLKAERFIEHIKLFLIGNDVFQTVYRRHRIMRDDLGALFDATESWGKNLPGHMQLPEIVTPAVGREKLLPHLSFQWITLVLHFPFYQAHPNPLPCIYLNQRAVQTCDQAADRIVHLLEAYDNLRQIPIVGIQVAFSAGVIFLFQLERFAADPPQKQAAFDKLTKCKKFLEEMAHTWECATKTQKILENLCAQLEPLLQSSFNVGSGAFRHEPESFVFPSTVVPSDEPISIHDIASTTSRTNSGPCERLSPRSNSLFDEMMGYSGSIAQELGEFFSGQGFPSLNLSPAMDESPPSSYLSNTGSLRPEDPLTLFSLASGYGVPGSSEGAIRGILKSARVSQATASNSRSANAPAIQERGIRRSAEGWM